MKQILPVLFLVLILLAACAPETPVLTETPTDLPVTLTPTLAPTVTATPEPPVRLTICTASLPESLFLYDGNLTPEKQNILAMLQDGPFDRAGEETVPVILERMPAVENGGLVLEPVTVQPGQTVVDARGELVVLKPGVVLRPSGCREAGCAVAWDGASGLTMDRMVVTFSLKEGLTWSDGTPLTATDSVFSFNLASDPDAPGLSWAEARTAAYRAPDDRTVIWEGKPGFTTADPARFFWVPLPAHLTDQEAGWAEMVNDPSMARGTPSYGPFMVSEWGQEGLLLIRNPYYFRSGEGLPRIDEIYLRPLPEGPQAAWAAFESGECDLLDDSFGFEHHPDLIEKVQETAGVALYPGQARTWAQLVFGIQPASYDEYYNPVYGDRPDLFGDARTRQALVQCLDRDALVSAYPAGLLSIWHSFMPPGLSQVGPLPVYDPVAGAQALDLAGWKDHDLNPETPRQAWEVLNVPPGTLLTLDLYTSQAGLRLESARIIQESLKACGVGVTVVEQPAVALFVSGPEGPLFGRQFDLGLLSWQPLPGPDCGYYASWQIPSASNFWIGTNLAGFSSEAYDSACADAALALPEEWPERLTQAETTFQESLPAVPLYGVPPVLILPDALCLPEGMDPGHEFFAQIETLAGEKNCP